jgi:hypothetical protein
MTDKYYWVSMTWHGAAMDLRDVWKLTLGRTNPFAYGFLAKGGLRRPGWFVCSDSLCIQNLATLPTRTSLADAKNIAKTILLSLKEST